jgi:signal transduction histidine kinase
MGMRILRTLWRYGAGASAVVLLLWGSIAIRQFWGRTIDPTSLIILTLIATAWYGGLGPGLLVAALFEGMLDYSSYPPRDPVRFYMIAFNRALLFMSLVVFASSRRSAEKRLRKQQKVLEEALGRERDVRNEAEAANRVKDEFLATVSHELRTPLNAMVGWAALLTRHQADEATTRRAAETIERNARAQANIVEDILDVSRIAAGGLHITMRPVLLAPAIQDALESVRLSAKEKAIAIEARLQNDLVVLGDTDRLRQIAWNLLSNAIKFTPPGGQIDVELNRADDHAELQVRDSGIGISADFLPLLFERFQQADPSMTRERAGLGLGLAIVRHLVELQGGTVRAESGGKDKGAVFTVKLPLAKEGVSPAPSPSG